MRSSTGRCTCLDELATRAPHYYIPVINQHLANTFPMHPMHEHCRQGEVREFLHRCIHRLMDTAGRASPIDRHSLDRCSPRSSREILCISSQGQYSRLPPTHRPSWTLCNSRVSLDLGLPAGKPPNVGVGPTRHLPRTTTWLHQ